MNNGFLQFYKQRLKKRIMSIQNWVTWIITLFIYLFAFKKAGIISSLDYAYKIWILLISFFLVNLIVAFVAWLIKNNKVNKGSK